MSDEDDGELPGTPTRKRRLSELDTNVLENLGQGVYKAQKCTPSASQRPAAHKELRVEDDIQNSQERLLTEELEGLAGTQFPDEELFNLPCEGLEDDESQPAAQEPEAAPAQPGGHSDGKALLIDSLSGPSLEDLQRELSKYGSQEDADSQDFGEVVLPGEEPSQQPAAARRGQDDLGEAMLDDFLNDQEGFEDDLDFPEDDDFDLPHLPDEAQDKQPPPAAVLSSYTEGKSRPIEKNHQPQAQQDCRPWLDSESDLEPPAALPNTFKSISKEKKSRAAAVQIEAKRPYQTPKRFAGDAPGAVMPVTGSDREQVFCELQDEDDCPVENTGFRKQRGGLLSRPVSEMLEAAEMAAYDRAVRASREAACTLDELTGASPASTLGKRGKQAPHPAEAAQDELWVDKYRPRGFVDLLSDPRVNLDVIKWLKEWDGVVFGRDIPGRKRAGLLKGFSSTRAAPEQRILLLSGPPGLGKTTLAHVAARHCGYRPLEINASDDRTGAALHSRLTAAAEMQSVLGARLPNCIILDEVDGAAGGAEGKSAISTLLKLTMQGRTEPAAAGAKQKRKKGQQPLNRPIIAICNDLYAPVLRPLRQVAASIALKDPQVQRLVSRMQQIAKAEKLKVDRQVLALLAEKAECDVRSCLNTLQFLAKRHGKITAASISETAVGQKDMAKGAFTVWSQLLSSKATTQLAKREESERMHSLLLDFGDHELVMSGLHENAFRQPYQDSYMRRTCEIYDHLQTADALMTASRRTMNFGFLAYVPVSFLGIRNIVAENQRSVRLQWPKLQAEAARTHAGNRALLDDWRGRVSSAAFHSLSIPTAVMEIVPCLLRVAVRPLRAVDPHLFTPEEKATLAGLAALLNDYSFTFDLGSAVLSSAAPPVLLKPELQNLANFPSFKTAAGTISVDVRQMVAREALTARLRQRTAEADGDASSSRPLMNERASTKIGRQTSRPQTAESNKFLYSVAQRAEEAGTGPVAARLKKDSRKLNWLEQMRSKRDQQRAAAPKGASNAQEGKAAPRVLYKYHEGVTNAVKRPLLLEDLL